MVFTGYNLFVRENKAKMSMSQIREVWKALSVQEKRKYNERVYGDLEFKTQRELQENPCVSITLENYKDYLASPASKMRLVPEKGLIAYKSVIKSIDPSTNEKEYGVLTLFVPLIPCKECPHPKNNLSRSNVVDERFAKFRCNAVLVIEGAGSSHYIGKDFIYEQGKWIYPKEDYSNNENVCGSGIHFFMVREAAENYPDNLTANYRTSKSGIRKRYEDDGFLSMQKTYNDNGQYHGECIIYDRDGSIRTWEYKDDDRDGKYTKISSTIKIEGEYKENWAVGSWQVYRREADSWKIVQNIVYGESIIIYDNEYVREFCSQGDWILYRVYDNNSRVIVSGNIKIGNTYFSNLTYFTNTGEKYMVMKKDGREQYLKIYNGNRIVEKRSLLPNNARVEVEKYGYTSNDRRYISSVGNETGDLMKYEGILTITNEDGKSSLVNFFTTKFHTKYLKNAIDIIKGKYIVDETLE